MNTIIIHLTNCILIHFKFHIDLFINFDYQFIYMIFNFILFLVNL